jgi:uncharacterized protein YeaO (DUF488 family)
MTKVLIKRAYEKYAKADGFRVLVDRVWPRGMTKEALHVDTWARDIAPSTPLRQWFGHDPAKWPEFRKRYKRELQSPDTLQRVKDVIAQAGKVSTITLVYSAHDELHNQAVVLRELFERRVSRATTRATKSAH